MRKQLTKGTNFNAAQRKKRFLYKTWANPKAPLHGMRTELSVSNWKESIGAYTQGAPKKVKQVKNRRYYKPKISPLGQRIVKLSKKSFQPYAWKRGKKRDKSEKGGKSIKKYKQVFERAGDDRGPWKDSERGKKMQLTGSMYELLTKKTSIAKTAFRKVTRTITKDLRSQIDFNMSKQMKGRPIRRNGFVK